MRDLAPMHARVIEAVSGSGATVIVPGNVYVFGARTPAPWSENSPHSATNPLGRLRIEMEAAYARAGIRTILLRGGDFIDTRASGNWFDLIMTKRLSRGVFTYPGDPDIPHAWAYLPDMARAAVGLAALRDSLPEHADIPFPGYTLTGREIAGTLEQVTGAQLRVARFNWWPLALMSPFVPMMRGLREMRYLWTTPHSLDGARLAALLPEFRATPVREAMATAIAHPQTTPDSPTARA